MPQRNQEGASAEKAEADDIREGIRASPLLAEAGTVREGIRTSPLLAEAGTVCEGIRTSPLKACDKLNRYVDEKRSGSQRPGIT